MVHGVPVLSLRLSVCVSPALPDGAMKFDCVLIFPLTSNAALGVLVLIPTPFVAWIIKLSLCDAVCPPNGSRRKILSLSICPQTENISEFDPAITLLLHPNITERFQLQISLLSPPTIVLNIPPFILPFCHQIIDERVVEFILL